VELYEGSLYSKIMEIILLYRIIFKMILTFKAMIQNKNFWINKTFKHQIRIA
jgi:hypothetical protein